MAKTAIRKKTSKTKSPVIRRSSSKLLEEKHIGREVVDWSEVTEAKVHECLRHYGYFYDGKDYTRWATAWVKKNKTKSELAFFSAAEDWRISSTLASLCKMMTNGAVFNAKRMDWINTKIRECIDVGKRKKGNGAIKSVAPVSNRRSIQEIMKENTSDFIGEIEGVVDTFFQGVWTDVENYSVYNELKKINAPAVTGKSVVDYYTPLQSELKELITKKTPDLVEAYTGMTIKRRKEYLKLVTTIIDDAEKYVASKKAVRKPRTKKSVSVSQQISKVTYMKDSNEFKLASIDPSEIVGAKEVYLFNVKYRTLVRLVSSARDGFTLKGTTVQSIDLEASDKKKLRKPDEFFTAAGKTKAKMVKAFESIKTKSSVANGRINGETLIYKAFK